MRIDTGNKVVDLKPASFRQRIEDIWKNTLDLHLIPIEVDTSLIKISGYISRPEYARRRNPLQYLIVNGRNMRHPYFHKAIVGCYDSLIAPDSQPCYFLKFQVNPDSIDVNIHPTKNEIKFEYEQDIWPILQAAVKAALGKFGAVPSIDFSVDVVPVVPVDGGKTPTQPAIDMPADYTPFSINSDSRKQANISRQSGEYWNRSTQKPGSNWDMLYSEFMRGSHDFAEDKEASRETDGVIEDFNVTSLPGNICLQYADRYIVTTSKDGVIIIDQRRAHIKILFEEYLDRLKEGSHSSQGIMFPDSMVVDPNQQNVLEEILPELNKIGFKIEYDSDNIWNITGIPSFLKSIDARDIVLKMIEAIDDAGENYGKEGSHSEDLIKKIALVMARSAAISYNRKLSAEEMEHITGKLFSLPDPSFTPNGNRIFHLIDSATLFSFFR